MSCVVNTWLRSASAHLATGHRLPNTDAPLEIARQSEVLIHRNCEPPLEAPRSRVLRHQRGLRIHLPRIRALHPVRDRLHHGHSRHAELAGEYTLRSATRGAQV